jgi:hypothetical protein
MELQDGWERIKTSVTKEHFSKKNLVAPMALSLEVTLLELNVKLSELVDEYNERQRQKYQSKLNTQGKSAADPIILEVKGSRGLFNRSGASNKLLIPPALLHDCFDGTVRQIVDKTREVFKTHLQDGVQHLILYGGLGSCDYLQEHVRRNFGDQATIHCPPKSSLIVMKGAVKYGMFPRIVNSRRARMTVGVKVTTPFVRGVHNKQPHIKHKYYDEQRREYFIRDAFKTFVVRDQLVDTQERYRHVFAPASKDSDSIKFDVYASGSRHVDYVTDPGCLKLARIVVPVDKGSMRNVTMELSFGYTEIRAYVLDDAGQVVREVPLLYDRVGENAIISENDQQVDGEQGPGRATIVDDSLE